MTILAEIKLRRKYLRFITTHALFTFEKIQVHGLVFSLYTIIMEVTPCLSSEVRFAALLSTIHPPVINHLIKMLIKIEKNTVNIFVLGYPLCFPQRWRSVYFRNE